VRYQIFYITLHYNNKKILCIKLSAVVEKMANNLRNLQIIETQSNQNTDQMTKTVRPNTDVIVLASATNSLSDIVSSFSILIATLTVPLYLPWTTFCTHKRHMLQT